MTLDPNNADAGADAQVEQNDFLNMSDEDFLKAAIPAPTQAEDEPAPTGSADSAAAAEADPKKDTADEAAADTGSVVADNDAGGGDDSAADAAAKSDADPAKTDDPSASADGKPAAAEAGKEAEGKDKADPKVDGQAEEKAPDYEGFFKQVMAPFKANGREFQLKTPEEAIRLMQMGAGYGRKLQDLQPALKTLKMLEKNDLLDEGKLSFLIDINNKNPEAIKKLIADSGIDPLDINTGDNVTYTPTNHSVTDKEMAFTTKLSEIQSQEGGRETLTLVNQTWDQESKSLLWDQPEILQVIQDQRANGFYDQIVAEVERQKILGTIPQNAPFLQAYKAAGDHLQANNAFVGPDGKPIQTQPQTPPKQADPAQPQVIATRAAAPKAQVQNDDQAAAAASTKTTPSRKPGAPINPLALSDEDFLKQFEGRL